MFSFRSSTTSSTTRIGVVRFACRACGTEANSMFVKSRVSGIVLLIPFWYTRDYFMTCGNCFATFKLDKDRARELEGRLRRAGNIPKG